MADPVWQNLSKAQDNPQTISEAILAAISEHNDDPTAHLASGQSIDVHRTNTTIDHPVGAVLSDKNTLTEIFISDNFSNLTHYTNIGDVSNSNWPSVALYVETGYVAESRLLSTPQSPAPFLTKTKDSLFQLEAHFDLSTSHYYGWLGLCAVVGATPAPTDGYGFYIQDGTLKAFVVNAGTPSYTTITGVTLSQAHIYRAQLNAYLGKIYFYIDGVQVATKDVPATDWASDSGPDMGIFISATNDGNMFISDLNFSRAI